MLIMVGNEVGMVTMIIPIPINGVTTQPSPNNFSTHTLHF